MAQTEFNGFGLVVRERNNGIEGGFGFGLVLGTNLTLDVQTLIMTPVVRNTPYSISYTDPADGQVKTLSILHEPTIPYSPPKKLPENTLLTLTVPASSLYQGLTATLTIAPNASPVWRVRLAFNNAYARLQRKVYF